MRGFRAVAVECRAEGRADQRPRRLLWDDDWLEIDRILDAWLERGVEVEAPTWRCFRVACGPRVFELRTQDPGWLWQAREMISP